MCLRSPSMQIQLRPEDVFPRFASTLRSAVKWFISLKIVVFVPLWRANLNASFSSGRGRHRQVVRQQAASASRHRQSRWVDDALEDLSLRNLDPKFRVWVLLGFCLGSWEKAESYEVNHRFNKLLFWSFSSLRSERIAWCFIMF